MKTKISLKHINKLAIPALIAGISEPILSLTDAAVVGNVDLNATESLAAIGIVTTFISMLIWVLGQTRSAISSIISQHLGANALDQVRQLPAQAIFLITSLSIFIIAITYPLAAPIFKLYNAENLILDYSVEYYRIRVLGFPFTLFVIAVFGTFRGLQNTYYPMVIAISGAALNVILDFILVYGIDGVITGQHIKGAAYASLIAQVFMALFSAYLLLTKTSIPLRFSFPLNPQIKNFALMILNLFIRTLALNITLYLATKYATGYGKNYIAAYTIAINLWFLGAFIIDGYASAGNILSGKLFGQKNYNQLIKLSNKLIKYGIYLGITVAIICSILYYPIGRIFTDESNVLNQFYSVFWIVLAMQPLCALAFIFDGIFKGLGKMKVLRNVLLLSTFLVFIPILFIVDYFDLKLHGIFIAFTFWIIARGLPLIIIFRKQFLPLTQNN
ncbi:putative MATE family efflux protein [Mesoflavibacter sabulilitoris]|uniref:Multidrug-efflux transporter n=1 Tax=Mesoflavibacter zeaxanthinifaciens subsp. sabulilitoris TaxID=1520893 RepID=A0A2T1N6Q0_9FLAO|nr:MATE family efflux transporter [Mesoflavibacter zeaxanthinifaciens]MBB3123084.1 putative MATE family efflux protein [Mesoflavibacter zeaxanthinifaciens subsp. sabulilitoris]PSG87268.1 MATE family efflux transporter [Mesoflavibacter zeaxanthinifaciens subsp. sabulilitoris]